MTWRAISAKSYSKAAAGKFAATTGANMAGSVLKDAAFARLFGRAWQMLRPRHRNPFNSRKQRSQFIVAR
jgi:hypothetical protein